jgi:hypothetical protein
MDSLSFRLAEAMAIAHGLLLFVVATTPTNVDPRDSLESVLYVSFTVMMLGFAIWRMMICMVARRILAMPSWRRHFIFSWASGCFVATCNALTERQNFVYISLVPVVLSWIDMWRTTRIE